MSGLLLIGAVLVWIVIVFVLASILTSTIKAPAYKLLFTSLVAAALFMLPLTDELVAWPRLQAMCESAGKRQFGPGMDEKKAFGREVYSVMEQEYWSLFPSVHRLTQNEYDLIMRDKLGNVLITKVTTKYVDSKTGELVLLGYYLAPISSSFAFPDSSGGRNTWILKSCGYATRSDFEKDRVFFVETLKLKEVEESVITKRGY